MGVQGGVGLGCEEEEKRGLKKGVTPFFYRGKKKIQPLYSPSSNLRCLYSTHRLHHKHSQHIEVVSIADLVLPVDLVHTPKGPAGTPRGCSHGCCTARGSGSYTAEQAWTKWNSYWIWAVHRISSQVHGSRSAGAHRHGPRCMDPGLTFGILKSMVFTSMLYYQFFCMELQNHGPYPETNCLG